MMVFGSLVEKFDRHDLWPSDDVVAQYDHPADSFLVRDVDLIYWESE